MSTLVAQTISNGTVSTSSENVIQGSAKAWVNFNGTGTPAIRASYNVSSITDNGTGDYTINFTNALADANYSVVAPALSISVTALVQVYPFTIAGGAVNQSAPTASGFRVATQGSSGTAYDPQYVLIAVFR